MLKALAVSYYCFKFASWRELFDSKRMKIAEIRTVAKSLPLLR